MFKENPNFLRERPAQNDNFGSVHSQSVYRGVCEPLAGGNVVKCMHHLSSLLYSAYKGIMLEVGQLNIERSRGALC